MAGSSSTSSRRANEPPFRVQRQRAGGDRSAAFFAVVLERAAVLGEGRARHRHAESGALLAGGEERRAHPLQHIARHAAAGIANFNPRVTVAPDDAYLDTAA